MTTFTSTMPDALFDLLSQKAKELNIPKNKLIERALVAYLTQLDKAAYIRSYKRMQLDKDILSMAEEGMADYHKILVAEDNNHETR